MDGGPSVELSGIDGENAYSGVARLRGGQTCTAVLLDTRAAAPGAEELPAYVLTAGHCAGAFGANEVITGRAEADYEAAFHFFADTAADELAIGSVAVAFATMKGTDLALIELDATLAELEEAGVRAWRAATEEPRDDEPVVVVGAPLNPDGSDSYLRLAACPLEGVAPVVLERQWTWFDALRHRCADVRPGSSGSPVVSRRSGRLLGIVGTTTIGSEGSSDCALNRPCEAEGASAASREGTNYAAPTAGIEACFDDLGRLDLARDDCPLDDGRQIRATPDWLSAANPELADPPLGRPRPRWDVSLSGPFEGYRYKTGPAGGVDCRSTDGYGGLKLLAREPTIDDALPSREGRYSLCVLGAGTSEEQGQDRRHPTLVAVQVDKTPPAREPDFEIVVEPEAYRITWRFDPPEIAGILFAAGPPGATSCADRAAYRPALIPFLSLPRREAPYRLCVIGFDAAGNSGAPVERILP